MDSIYNGPATPFIEDEMFKKTTTFSEVSRRERSTRDNYSERYIKNNTLSK